MIPVPIEQPLTDITPEMEATDAALRHALHAAVDDIFALDKASVTGDIMAALARYGMYGQVAHLATLAAQRNALLDAFLDERERAYEAAYSDFIAKGNAADPDYFPPEELEGR